MVHSHSCLPLTGNTFLCSLDFNVKMALKLDVSTRAVMGLVIGEKKIFFQDLAENNKHKKK